MPFKYPAGTGKTSPSKEPVKPRGRKKPGTMNGLETAWADVLRAKECAGEVAWWRYESVNFRIGENCYYRPDFLVMLADGSLEIHETKGFFHDDAKVKVRAVAEMYPFPLKVIKKVKGEWEITDY